MTPIAIPTSDKGPPWRWLVLGLLTLLAGETAADPADDAYGAYQLGDYARASELWYPLAEKGNVEAQYYLGTLFAEGKVDGAVTPVRAVFWLGRAANAGYVEAQYRLATMYYQGDGVPRNLPAALAWWQQAAGQGHAESLLSLARLAHAGKDVPMDLDQAALLYQAAAQAGSQAAWLGLAQLEQDRARLAEEHAAAREEAEALLARAKPAKRKSAAHARPQVPKGGYLGVDWIMAQPPTRYTIQLLGARDLGPIEALLQDLPGDAEISVYAFRRKGALWYAVIYGSYASEATARNAAARLQTAGTEITPWVRRFGNIQALDPR